MHIQGDELIPFVLSPTAPDTLSRASLLDALAGTLSMLTGHCKGWYVGAKIPQTGLESVFKAA